MREATRVLGIELPVGVHTGEVEVLPNFIGGTAVHAAARIMAMGGPSEIVVSSMTRGLVEGSDLRFNERGPQGVKGLQHSRSRCFCWPLKTRKGAGGENDALRGPAGRPVRRRSNPARRPIVNAGRYESDQWGGSYERIQTLSVGELLAGTKPDVPKFLPAYQKAAKIAAAAGEQQELFGS